jgi:hypothetical protein
MIFELNLTINFIKSYPSMFNSDPILFLIGFWGFFSGSENCVYLHSSTRNSNHTSCKSKLHRSVYPPAKWWMEKLKIAVCIYI